MTKRSNILFLFASLFFCTSLYFSHNLQIYRPRVDLQKEEYNFNEKTEVFNFGQKRALSSLIWVKTIIDADLEHYQKQDLKSWLFLRFKTILNLDPLFLEAYRFGGLYLSVAKDDIKGATVIFDRGLAEYPDDYIINLYAGYHFYLEDKNYKKALTCFKKVIKNPEANPLIHALVASIMMKKTKHSKDEIRKQIMESLKHIDNEFIRKNLLDKLEGLDK